MKNRQGYWFWITVARGGGGGRKWSRRIEKRNVSHALVRLFFREHAHIMAERGKMRGQIRLLMMMLNRFAGNCEGEQSLLTGWSGLHAFRINMIVIVANYIWTYQRANLIVSVYILNYRQDHLLENAIRIRRDISFYWAICLPFFEYLITLSWLWRSAFYQCVTSKDKLSWVKPSNIRNRNVYAKREILRTMPLFISCSICDKERIRKKCTVSCRWASPCLAAFLVCEEWEQANSRKIKKKLNLKVGQSNSQN